MVRSDSSRQSTVNKAFTLAVVVSAAVMVACSPVGTLAQPTYEDAYLRFQYPEGWSVSAGADPRREGFWRVVVDNPRSKVEVIEIRYRSFTPDTTGIWTIGDGISQDQFRSAAKAFGGEYLAGHDEDFAQGTVPAGFSQTVARRTQSGTAITLQGTTVWAGGQFAHIAFLRDTSASTAPHDLVLRTLAFASFSLVGDWSEQGSGLTLGRDGTFDRYYIRDRGVFATRDRGRYRIEDKTVTLQTATGQTICSLTYRDGTLTGCGSSYRRN
jgi:hypothetical protein